MFISMPDHIEKQATFRALRVDDGSPVAAGKHHLLTCESQPSTNARSRTVALEAALVKDREDFALEVNTRYLVLGSPARKRRGKWPASIG